MSEVSRCDVPALSSWWDTRLISARSEDSSANFRFLAVSTRVRYDLVVGLVVYWVTLRLVD